MHHFVGKFTLLLSEVLHYNQAQPFQRHQKVSMSKTNTQIKHLFYSNNMTTSIIVVLNSSFRIRRDFSFDDAVSARFGCEVHSFDPGYVSCTWKI